jgi:hypothetical protein
MNLWLFSSWIRVTWYLLISQAWLTQNEPKLSCGTIISSSVHEHGFKTNTEFLAFHHWRNTLLDSNAWIPLFKLWIFFCKSNISPCIYGWVYLRRKYMCMYVCVWLCMYMCVYVCICMCVVVCVCGCVCVYVGVQCSMYIMPTVHKWLLKLFYLGK